MVTADGYIAVGSGTLCWPTMLAAKMPPVNVGKSADNVVPSRASRLRTVQLYSAACVHQCCKYLNTKSIQILNQTVNDGVAHSKNQRKCAYHVTFDLDLDLEHTLDAR